MTQLLDLPMEILEVILVEACRQARAETKTKHEAAIRGTINLAELHQKYFDYEKEYLPDRLSYDYEISIAQICPAFHDIIIPVVYQNCDFRLYQQLKIDDQFVTDVAAQGIVQDGGIYDKYGKHVRGLSVMSRSNKTWSIEDSFKSSLESTLDRFLALVPQLTNLRTATFQAEGARYRLPLSFFSHGISGLLQNCQSLKTLSITLLCEEGELEEIERKVGPNSRPTSAQLETLRLELAIEERAEATGRLLIPVINTLGTILKRSVESLRRLSLNLDYYELHSSRTSTRSPPYSEGVQFSTDAWKLPKLEKISLRMNKKTIIPFNRHIGIEFPNVREVELIFDFPSRHSLTPGWLIEHRRPCSVQEVARNLLVRFPSVRIITLQEVRVILSLWVRHEAYELADQIEKETTPARFWLNGVNILLKNCLSLKELTLVVNEMYGTKKAVESPLAGMDDIHEYRDSFNREHDRNESVDRACLKALCLNWRFGWCSDEDPARACSWYLLFFLGRMIKESIRTMGNLSLFCQEEKGGWKGSTEPGNQILRIASYRPTSDDNFNETDECTWEMPEVRNLTIGAQNTVFCFLKEFITIDPRKISRLIFDNSGSKISFLTDMAIKLEDYGVLGCCILGHDLMTS
ncbi:hypothetical protein H072_8447 [Dactylellina haptotyla CBS 200.50]|uniref:Uncharacterized protein n=1 Tax=Dactylellina haptotyla (strain CBS 200.50) TaxID=1284197 RepID=S8A508_DACHA|nr:hypothetical protein H072_8447 [Dactylellina haptotyla CBS 200.50]